MNKDLVYSTVLLALSAVSVYWYGQAQIRSGELKSFEQYSKAAGQNSLAHTTALVPTCPEDTFLIVFAFTEKLSFNVEFFLRHGVFEAENVDFVMVMNGPSNVTVEELYKHTNGRPKNLHLVHKPENEGWDFCMFQLVLDLYLPTRNYSHLVLLNRTVRGPFLPSYFKGTWLDAMKNMLDEKVAITGLTFNCMIEKRKKTEGWPSPISEYPGIHIQSMALVMDKRVIDLYHSRLLCVNDKLATIAIHEVAATQWFIFNAGWYPKPITFQWKNIDVTKPDEVVLGCEMQAPDPWLSGGVIGPWNTIHPVETIFVKTNRLLTKEMEKFAEIEDKFLYYSRGKMKHEFYE